MFQVCLVTLLRSSLPVVSPDVTSGYPPPFYAGTPAASIPPPGKLPVDQVCILNHKRLFFFVFWREACCLKSFFIRLLLRNAPSWTCSDDATATADTITRITSRHASTDVR